MVVAGLGACAASALASGCGSRRLWLAPQFQAQDGVVLRGLHTAIVDEADSVLIDEAVTPLIIAESEEDKSQMLVAIAQARERVDTLWTVESTRVLRGPRERSAFVHAKWYAFVRGDVALVLLGSANVSRAAWTANREAGNAELLAVRRMTRAELESELLGELTIESKEPELPDQDELEDDADTEGASIVAVAHQARGRLRVSWKCPEALRLVEMRVDGASILTPAAAANAVEVPHVLPASRVALSFLRGDVPIAVETWVDDERELATSARERRMTDLVDDYAREGSGDLAGWLAILEPFEAELREAAATAGMKATGRRPVGESALDYEWADVFPDDEDAATGTAGILFAARTAGGRASQMRTILLSALEALLPDEDRFRDREVRDELQLLVDAAQRRELALVARRVPVGEVEAGRDSDVPGQAVVGDAGERDAAGRSAADREGLGDLAGRPHHFPLTITRDDGQITTFDVEIIHTLPVTLTDNNENLNGIDWELPDDPLVLTECAARISAPDGTIGHGHVERSIRRSRLTKTTAG